MSIKHWALSFFLYSNIVFADGLQSSVGSLKSIAFEFLPIIKTLEESARVGDLIRRDDLQSTNPEITEWDEHFLSYKGYKFSYNALPDSIISIKVYGFKRTFSIFSIFDCINYFEYNSSQSYKKEDVVKKVDDWAFIEACHA